MPNRIGPGGHSIALYLPAGFATAPDFMVGFRDAMLRKIRDTGRAARAELLFPYGDWSRSPLSQLWEIRRDLGFRLPAAEAGERETPLGARRVIAALASAGESEEVWLIGHSAGGMAALQAAAILERAGGAAPARIVLIGSPKLPVPSALRARTLALYAAARTGWRAGRRCADPVHWFGSWRGRSMRRSGRLPLRRKVPETPGRLVGIPIRGGHADYFRAAEPFVDPEGISNLDLTMAAIWSWIEQERNPIP